MAMETLRIVPGFDVEKTPTLNEAGVSDGQLIRWREGVPEKLGGAARFFPNPIGSIPRELHAWKDVNNNLRLAVGATAALKVITAGAIIDITPQTTTTNTSPNFSTVNGSATVTIVDANISNPSTNNSVFISTPFSIGGIVLFGIYPIATVISTTSYTIQAATAATSTTSTQTSSGATWAATGGGQLTITTSAPTGVAVGANITVYGMSPAGYNGIYTTLAGTTGSTVIVSQPSNLGAGTGGTVCPGAVPTFTTINASAAVTVTLDNHGLQAGQSTVVLVSTTANGLTISGTYLAQAPVTTNAYGLTINGLATSSGTVAVNAGQVQATYYIAIGPQSPFSGWGVGNWGAGGWGTGTALPSGSGTPITATDWTTVNWGEILLACPAGGGIYQWGPESALQNAQLVYQAPVMADGIELAQPQQILMAWGVSNANGVQNSMRIAWCDAANFTIWTATSGNFAGGVTIPRGSTIVRVLQAPQQLLAWTDLGVWIGNYVGQPQVFAFTLVMEGCGLVGRKACGTLGTVVYWMSAPLTSPSGAPVPGQFFQMAAGGAPAPMPCPVWDYVFQNLDIANASKVRFFSNAEFNEIGWYFPSKSGGNGENDSYVKFNVVEGEWDYGPGSGVAPSTAIFGRSAWIDQSVLGPPIAGTAAGLIMQHEISPDIDGVAMNSYVRTGDFALGKGEDFQFVDYVVPNFRYGKLGAAPTGTMLVTFYTKAFADDTPQSQGPYTVNIANPNFIEPRLRGRLASFRIESQDLGSFWRAGLVRYRVAPDGKNP